MAGGFSEHTEAMLIAAKHRGVKRGLLALAGAAVLLVTVWALVLPGATMANTTFCGQEAHKHSDACYQRVLACGFDAASAESGVSSAESTSDALGAASGEQPSSESGAEGAANAEASGVAGSAGEGSGPASAGTSAENGVAAVSDGGAVAESVSAAGAAGEPDVEADAAVVGLVSEAVAAELPSSSSAASSSGHVHSEACYKSVLVCDLSEHEHSLACYSDSSADVETEAVWEATLPADDDMTGNWAADVLAVAESQLGYKESSANYAVAENASGVEVAKGYTRYGAWWGDAYGDWCAMFASFCLSYAGVPEEAVPQNANCQSWIEALAAENVWLWRPVEAVEDADGAVQRTGVAVVPAEVVAAREAEAAEAAADEGSAESSTEAAARYTALGGLIYDPQPGDLVFFDWDNDGSADHVGFVYELLDADGNVVACADADSAVDEGSSDAEGVDEDASSGDAVSADADLVLSENPAAKLKTIEGNVSDGSADTVRYKEYDLADSSILGYASLPENSETQVATLALDEPMVTSYGIESAKPTTVESASTSEFIDLNLYDYVSSDVKGENFVNKYYKSGSKYPGFQWNGGAYMASGTFNRHEVDYIDFGNSNITDIGYGGTDEESGKENGYSKNRVSVGVLYNNGSQDTTGAINWLWWDGTSPSITNRPVGMSTTSTSALSRNLLNGYPALADETTSLSYLFTNGNYVKQQNTKSIDGLFQYDDITGAYYYNSRENHAQYSNNEFTLYNQIITPNFIVYPFGNFLPFNTITDSDKATQVSSIDGEQGSTVSDYVQKIQNDLTNHENYDNSPTRKQLNTMLEKYQIDIGTETSIKTAKQAISDYLVGSGATTSDDLVTDALLSKMYNIDWDEETDFFFGMDMTMNFMQPKGGMTGNDTNGDGESDYPMEFYFTGDDDVWVYIDGVLFLDLTGIHRHVGGKIDFVNGKVDYYALDTANGGDVSSKPYKTYTFKELLEAAGKSTDGLNEKGTFKDYSTHQFKFYYMERGSGSSVCRMNFNFPLLKQNTISVSKEVAADDANTLLGNPDYQFQILKADGSGNKTDELLIGDNVKYTIYNSSAEKIGTGLTDSNGVFTLKAGQCAEFAGIEESAGKYYVRELFDGSTLDQYGSVTVSGELVTVANGVTVGTERFTGMDSPIKNASDGSTTFLFKNTVDTNKLASLSITKKLEEYPQTRDVKRFNIKVELDDKPLPEGTEYTVTGGGNSEKCAVETAGIITIKPDETVTIGNILAGTEFSVQETNESAEGYAVAYEVDGKSVGLENGLATGTLSADQEVKLVVTNSEKGASTAIPVTKSLSAYDEKEYEFEFELREVTKTGDDSNLVFETKTGSVANLKKCSVESGIVRFNFPLDYALVDLGQLPVTRYYQVTEKQSASSLANNTVYVFQVDIVEDASSDVGAVAKVMKAWCGVMENGEPSDLEECVAANDGSFVANFTNTLVGSLEISKTVVGAATSEDFEFEVALEGDGSGLASLPEYYDAKICNMNGSAESAKSVKLKLVEKKDAGNEQSANDNEDANSKRVLEIVEADSSGGEGAEKYSPITLKDGESIVIEGIPYGTTWSVTEVNPEGFIVSASTSVVAANDSSADASTDEAGETSSGSSSSGSEDAVEESSSSTAAGAEASAASGEASEVPSSNSSAATISVPISVGVNKVEFTNTQMYELPDTGGAGVVVCVLAGLALVGAALFGMRRMRRRGEAV